MWLPSHKKSETRPCNLGFTSVQLDDENENVKDSSERIAKENEQPLQPKRLDSPVTEAARVGNVANIDHNHPEQKEGNKRVPGITVLC